MSYSESDEDEKERELRKRKKAQKQLSKHHELVLVFVERTGSNIFNGKYVYSTTTEEGYPIFEHVENKYLLIKQNEDDMRWEFIDNKKKQVFYYADSDKEFPPSSGWKKTKHGDLPNPGVRLDQIRSQEQTDNFFEDDPYKFSPFFIMKYKFEKVKSEPLGFDLKILQLHSQFVAVKSIKPDSQAETFGILPGDILVSANEVDLSKMTLIEDVSKAIEKLIKKLDNDKKEITITFAREKKTYKVLICQRAGSRVVNGKYSIQGKENDALCFAKNDNINLKIQRIYVNEEEDEAIWALREVDILKDKKGKKKPTKTRGSDSEDSEDNHRDYYIVLASAKDEVPPECAWEAVDPHGLWPAAGLQYYDVKVVSPSKPRIIRTQPNPNAVQIRFECDEEGRKPKVCPHMECWYEIEMRHYKYNVDKRKTSKKPHDTKIWKCQESPFVANRLINGDDYEFTVRTCNHIASTNSEISPRVTPLQLPPKPKILDITGKPGELYIHFHCTNAKDREVQAKFEIIIDPPIDEACQDYDIKEHRLLVDNDNKPVRLRNLINGTKYQIIVASVNSVGVTYSEAESAYPSKDPPLPVLGKVVAGSREIIVHFKCDGFDKPDVRAWFEMELDPPPPSIDQAGITYMSVTKDDEKDKENIERPTHSREKSRMRTKLARKSRWRRQTISQKLFMNCAIGTGGLIGAAVQPSGMGALPASPELLQDEKSVILKEEDSDDFVPYYRRELRHYGTPVKISPVVNGIPYRVKVKAVTLSGSKESEVSAAIIPKGPPPIPKINKLKPLESSVQIEFVCNDYATEEYKAKFDIESFPQTVTMKGIKTSPYVFPKLNNGRSYKFHLRGVNKEGKSKWSEVSAPVTPLKIPPQPIELRTVAFNKEITVFWVCEELKTPEYSGWYEVESEPPTFTMVVTRQQARFRRLSNGRKYTFKVTAVNQVGKSSSIQSKACIPDDDISKQEYNRKKKYIACEVKEILLKIRKKQKQQKAHDKIITHNKKKMKQKKRDKEKSDDNYKKIMAKKHKKQKQQESKKRKADKERQAKKMKMDEQRARVLKNKRRMSFLARERVSKMDLKFGVRNKGKNTHTASSMMMTARKPKISKTSKPKTSKPPRGAASPLLDMNEINKLNKERERDEKRSSKLKKGSKTTKSTNRNNRRTANGTSLKPSSSNSSTRKSSKKRKGKIKKEKVID
eukprot:233316_1